MSSSPLPSPSAIEHQPPKGAKAGSKMAPIPVDAPTGFLSAMSLVTDEQLQQAQTHHSDETSKKSSPSLEETGLQESSKPSERAATGKLKKPTKKLSTSTIEMPSDASLDIPLVKPAPRRRASKKTTATVDLTEGDQGASSVPKRGRKKATTMIEDTESAPLSAPAPVPAPVPSRRGRKKIVADPFGEPTDSVLSQPKQPRKRTAKATSVVNGADNIDVIYLPELLEQSPKRRVGRPKKTTSAQVVETENDNCAVKHGNVVIPSEDEQRNSPLHGVSEPTTTSSSVDNHADVVESLDLESASRRKQSWTPPPCSALPPSFQTPSFHEVDEGAPLPNDLLTEVDTTGLEANMSDSTLDVTTKPSDVAEQPSRQPSFAELVGSFEYQAGVTAEQYRNESVDHCAQLVPMEPEEQEPRPVAPKKKRAPRKKAEPNEKPEPKEKADPKPRASRKKAEPKPKMFKEPKPKTPKEPKPKAPRKTSKKPLTITALATAAYRQQPLQALQEPGPATLESYLTAEPAKLMQGGEEKDQTGTAPRLRKRKSAGDKSASKRSKKDAAPEYRLQSPETAHQKLKNQDWLFGTSSQLAAAESPSEYRDLQRAIKESEELIGSQDIEGSQVMDLVRTASRLRVPSAPHGTDLSIGQANRDLWLSAARDVVDGTYAADNRLGSVSEELETVIVPGGYESLPAVVPPQGLLEKPSSDDEEAQDSGYVDIDDVLKNASNAKPRLDDTSLPQATVLPANTPQTIHAGANAIVTRAILQTLDLNTNLSEQAAALDEGAFSPSKQTVDEPTKDDLPAIVNLLTPPKKPRGRPRTTVTDFDVSKKVVVNASASPQRRGRGRPPISPHTSKNSSKRQPASSPYLDIDDISDTEAALNPHFPPRPKRRSSIIERTLELPNPTVVLPAKPRSEKQLQADWQTVSIALFPKITATVKAQPPTVDLKDPSWYEKMLLYDPIVLEDLTAWLHGQGLRIESERPKAAQKPKKGKNVDEEQTGEPRTVEMEVVCEELKPWMVQKWCEEHSICCLWKEGLRGGVRQRY